MACFLLLESKRKCDKPGLDKEQEVSLHWPELCLFNTWLLIIIGLEKKVVDNSETDESGS